MLCPVHLLWVGDLSEEMCTSVAGTKKQLADECCWQDLRSSLDAKAVGIMESMVHPQLISSA